MVACSSMGYHPFVHLHPQIHLAGVSGPDTRHARVYDGNGSSLSSSLYQAIDIRICWLVWLVQQGDGWDWSGTFRGWRLGLYDL